MQSTHPGRRDDRPLDYASRAAADRPAGAAAGAAFVLSLAGLPLSVSCVALVVKAAADEPFYGDVPASVASLFVGGGAALVALWLAWAAALIRHVRRRTLRGAFLCALLWPAVGVVFVSAAPIAYLGDRAAFERMIRQSPPPPAAGGGPPNYRRRAVTAPTAARPPAR